MERPEENMFDDPALKTALRRILGAEKSPAALRHRVEGLTKSPTPAGRLPGSRIFGASPLLGLAVAAVLLIGLGVLGLRLGGMFQSGIKYGKAMPANLTAALIATHDFCTEHAHPTHQFADAPINDFGRIAEAMQRDMGRAVMIADLRGDGWSFRGAKICPVKGENCPHLLYDRGAASVSIFSLPACMTPAGATDEGFTAETANHAVAGFRRGNEMFVMVGSSPDGTMSLTELRRLLDEHRGDVAAGSGAPRPTEWVELMRDR